MQPPIFKENFAKMAAEGYRTGISFLEQGFSILSGGMEAISAAGSIKENLYAVILPTGYVMLSVMVLIDIIDVTSKKGEELRWEDIIRILVRLVICKNLMTIAPMFMTALYEFAASLIKHSGDFFQPAFMAELEQSIADTIRTDPEGGLVKTYPTRLLQIFEFLPVWIMGFIVSACGVAAYVLSLSRIIELFVLQTLAPIPVAFAGWSNTGEIPRRFFLTYFSVCLQGVSMLICFRIYAVLWSAMQANHIILMALTLVLITVLLKSGIWTRELLGLQ